MENNKTNLNSDFDVTGTVIRYLGNGEYQVRFADGAEVVASAENGTEVGTGIEMGLCAVGGGWIMRDIGSVD